MSRFLAILSILLALSVTLTACDDAAHREAKYLERGKTLYQKGDYIKARLEFRNVLQINPKSVEAMYYMGRLDELNGNFRAAVGRYSRATEQDPKFIPARAHLAELYVMANKIPDAEAQMKAIFALEPDNKQAKTIKAGILFRRGDIEQAAALSGSVFAQDSGNASAVVIYAQSLFKLGRAEEALNALDKGIAKNPDNRNLVRLKIQHYLDTKQNDKAEQAYRTLIKRWPEDLASRTELAWFYINHNRLDDAEASLRNAVAELPNDDSAKRLLIDFLLNHRGFNAAEQELHKLIEQKPQKQAFKFGLARLYVENNRTAEAIDVYRKIIDQSGTAPDGLAARAALANILLSDKKDKGADALVGQILEQDPENSTALLLRGKILVSQGNYNDAIIDFRTILRDDPNSVGALGLLAEAHLRAGQTELAMDALRNLITLDPKNVQAIARLASINVRTGNVKEAESLIADATSVAPGDPAVLSEQASIQLELGRYRVAAATARKLINISGQEVSGRILLGRILAADHQNEEALAQFRKVLEIDANSAPALNGAILIMATTKRLDEAEKMLKNRIDKNPKDALTYNLLGQVYSVAGRDMKMVAPMFLQAAKLAPNWVEPLLNYDRVLIQRKEYAQALTVIQTGLQRAPSDEALSLDLAYVYEKIHDYKSAIATYDKMVERGQRNDVVANNLAALIADFEYDQGPRLERAFQLAGRFRDSKNPGYKETLGWVNYRLGNLKEAKRLIEEAMAMGLDLPQVQYHIGMIYLALGEKDRAQQALSKAVAGTQDFPGLDVAKKTLASF